MASHHGRRDAAVAGAVGCSIGRACMCLRSRGRKPCNSCNSCDKLNQVQSCAPQTPANLIEFVA